MGESWAFAYLAGPKVIYRTHDDQAHHNLDRMFGYGKRMLRKHFKSDPARYQRALASWYALHAKARWATARHVKTGVFLACSAFQDEWRMWPRYLRRAHDSWLTQTTPGA